MSTYSIHFGGYVEAFSSSFVLFYHSVIITRTKSPIQNQFKNMLPGPLACIIKCVFSIASYGILVWSVFHIKIPQSSGFDNRNSFSHSSRGWEGGDRSTGKLGFTLRSILLACRWTSPCCVVTCPLLCVSSCLEKEQSCLWCLLL